MKARRQAGFVFTLFIQVCRGRNGIRLILTLFAHNSGMKWAIKKIYRIAGNAYWKIFGGFALSLVWFAMGLLLIISVVGIAWGVKCIRVGIFVFKPFGKQTVTVFDRPLADALWAVSFGIVFGIVAVLGALASLVGLVTAPLCIQWLKVARVSVFPFSSYVR